MYYLQSRYYDPEVCRFINADAFASTGQGIIGNNMFAYCNNNPTNCFDTSGALPCQNNMRMSNDGGGARSINGNVPAKNNPSEISQFISNTDEQVVFDAKFLACYNGTLVIKLPIGTNSFSFGAIFLGNDAKNRADAVQLLQHEYGHSRHFSQIGMVSYTMNVFLPSIIGYHFGNDDYQANYYSHVYEYVADVLGGVTRTVYASDAPYNYRDAETKWAGTYYIYTLLYP